MVKTYIRVYIHKLVYVYCSNYEKGNSFPTPLSSLGTLGLCLKWLHKLISCFQVYCFSNTDDGLFDVKMYDITEVDAVSSLTAEEEKESSSEKSKYSNMPKKNAMSKEIPFQDSVLMILLDIDPERVFGFLQYTPISYTISEKYKAYRWVFYITAVVYFLFICSLTVHAVYSSRQVYNEANTFNVLAAPAFERSLGDDILTTTLGSISLLFSVLFLLQEIVRYFKKTMPFKWKGFANPYRNEWFRSLTLVMALCLIADFPAHWSPNYENYCLSLAVVCGWFLMLFFLRAIQPFAFFSLLVQRVFFDILRFAVMIALELLAFGTVIYMLLQGSEISKADPNLSSYPRVLATMVNLMVGLGELPDFYSTRHPTLIVIVFTAFIVMTTLLLINALIALMGDTCTSLMRHGGSQDYNWLMQRLSTVLFLESLLPNGWVNKIGKKKDVMRFNKALKQTVTTKRYLLEIKSLRDDSTDDSSNGPTNHTNGELWNYLSRNMLNVKRKKKAVGKVRPRSIRRQTLDICNTHVCPQCNEKAVTGELTSTTRTSGLEIHDT